MFAVAVQSVHQFLELIAFLLSDFCSCIILSSKDYLFSLRQHRCLLLKTFVLHLSLLLGTLQIVLGNTIVCAFFFISRELPLLGHMYLFWHLLPLFLQVCSSTFSCSRGMNPWQTISGYRYYLELGSYRELGGLF